MQNASLKFEYSADLHALEELFKQKDMLAILSRMNAYYILSEKLSLWELQNYQFDSIHPSLSKGLVIFAGYLISQNIDINSLLKNGKKGNMHSGYSLQFNKQLRKGGFIQDELFLADENKKFSPELFPLSKDLVDSKALILKKSDFR